MLKLSKKVEYGLMALLHMEADRGSQPVTSGDIADQYDIPAETLGKVMQSLSRAGIMSSAPGVKGGYRMAQSLRALTLGAVIEAIDGPVHMTKCQEEPEFCPRYADCTIKVPVATIQERVMEYIYGISLATFTVKAEKSSAKQVV